MPQQQLAEQATGLKWCSDSSASSDLHCVADGGGNMVSRHEKDDERHQEKRLAILSFRAQGGQGCVEIYGRE